MNYFKPLTVCGLWLNNIPADTGSIVAKRGRLFDKT